GAFPHLTSRQAALLPIATSRSLNLAQSPLSHHRNSEFAGCCRRGLLVCCGPQFDDIRRRFGAAWGRRAERLQVAELGHLRRHIDVDHDNAAWCPARDSDAGVWPTAPPLLDDRRVTRSSVDTTGNQWTLASKRKPPPVAASAALCRVRPRRRRDAEDEDTVAV